MENRPGLNFTVIDTLREIPKDSWERLFGQEVEGYGFHKTLEESDIPGFRMSYLIGKRQDKHVFIAPFFSVDFSFSDFTSGFTRKLILITQKIFKRFLRLRMLFLGTLTAEESHIGISAEEDPGLVLDEAVKAIDDFCRGNAISVFLFYNLGEKDNHIRQYLSRNRFFRMSALPSTAIELNAGSFDGYLETLSKNARKDLRRKLRRAAESASLTTEVREDIEGISEEVYRLYMNNLNESTISLEHLPREFFENIAKYMPGVAKFFITRDKGRIVAFNLCLVKDGVCIDKFIGLDSGCAKAYHLYFTTLAHNIDWCIRNNIRTYQAGATDYIPKVRLGARLIPLEIYAKALNPLLDCAAKLATGFLKPENLDPSLKRLEEFKKD